MPGAAIAADDFSLKVQNHSKENANEYFGFIKPIGASESVTVPRMPEQTASIVTRKSANNSDQMAFWPNDTTPTHIVTCIEAGNDEVGAFPSGQSKLSLSVQTVNLATGVDDGGLYEILNPLTTPDLTLVACGASEVVDGTACAKSEDYVNDDPINITGFKMKK